MEEHIVVETHDGPDLEFRGELLVNEGHHDIGGVKIYRTEGAKYVAKQTRSGTGGIDRIDRVGVFDDLESLAEWLGWSSGAKAILAKLGHVRRRRID